MNNDINELAGIIAQLTKVGLYPETHAQAVAVAVQIQRNRILKKALVLSDSDAQPGALEKIAMELEGNGKDLSRIESTVDDIDRKLRSIDTSVSNIENQD